MSVCEGVCVRACVCACLRALWRRSVPQTLTTRWRTHQLCAELSLQKLFIAGRQLRLSEILDGLGHDHVESVLQYKHHPLSINQQTHAQYEIYLKTNLPFRVLTLKGNLLLLLLNALSRRRREVNHVSFACAIPHVIIKFVA